MSFSGYNTMRIKDFESETELSSQQEVDIAVDQAAKSDIREFWVKKCKVFECRRM